jgi:hypothetical protein
MTPRSEFKMETRHTGGAHTNWAGIECGKCDADAWTQVRNGGWATREFRKQGWKIGNKPSQHRCPDCYGKAISQRRMIPDNPAIPPHIGVALLEDHVKKNLLDTSSLTHDLNEVGAVPWASSSDLVPPHPEHNPDILIPVRIVVVPAKRGGQPPQPGVTVFTRRDNATRSAQKFAGGTEGVSFFTYPLGEGWTWQHADKMSRAEKDAYWERQTLPTTTVKGHPRKRLPNPTHEPKPAPIPVVEAKEEAPMTVVSLTQKEPPMPQHQADPKTQQTTYDPGAAPRAPTRDQRMLIHDELTKAYDVVGQRYGGSDSDKALAERLDLPRAWVSDVRAMFFGDHDRNTAMEKRSKELDAAIDMANAATTHLMNLATEAEELHRKLIACRKLLEG